MKRKQMISLFMACSMMLATTACSSGESKKEASNTPQATGKEVANGNESEGEEAAAPKKDPAEIKGNIEVMYPGWFFSEDMDTVIAKFNETYPNISIETEKFDPAVSIEDALGTRAASNDLPDVFLGWGNVAFFAEQGWMYPLDELVANDPEFKEVSPQLLAEMTVRDQVYAIPYRVEFDTMIMNLDLLEQLNLDKPDYTWTWDEFTELAKAATTNKTSGLERIGSLSTKLVGVYGYENKLGGFGYQESTGKFNLTDGAWAKSLNDLKELSSVKGVVAETLIDGGKRDKGEKDDYQKKFGKDASALRENKVLMGVNSTWERDNIKNLPNKWDFYPYPRLEDGPTRISPHIDFGYMFSNCKDTEAAFEFLKYMTYGVQGNVERLQLQSERLYEDGEDKGQPKNEFYIPITTAPEVVEKLESLTYVPDGIKWIQSNLNSGAYELYRCCSRDIPNWDPISGQYVGSAVSKVMNEGISPETIAAETEVKANEELEKSKMEFDKRMEVVEKEFVELRKQIDGEQK